MCNYHHFSQPACCTKPPSPPAGLCHSSLIYLSTITLAHYCKESSQKEFVKNIQLTALICSKPTSASPFSWNETNVITRAWLQDSTSGHYTPLTKCLTLLLPQSKDTGHTRDPRTHQIHSRLKDSRFFSSWFSGSEITLLPDITCPYLLQIPS